MGRRKLLMRKFRGSFLRFFKSRRVAAIFLLLFLVFGFYSVKLIRAQAQMVVTKDVGTFKAHGELEHSAVFLKNSLYGEKGSMDNYPRALVDAFDLTYRYQSEPGLSEGHYIISVTTVYYVTKGTEEVSLWEEESFHREGKLVNGSFEESFTLNMTELNNRSALISEELGIKRLKRKMVFSATVIGTGDVNGRKVNEEFSHTGELVDDIGASIYYFSDAEKVEKKPFVDRSIVKTNASVLGINSNVETGRTVTTFLAFGALLPVLGYLYTSRPPKDETSKLRPYIVRGTPGKVSRKVVLESYDDLKKTFELIDRPIMNYREGNEDVYVIIDEGVAYEYRRQSPESEKPPS